MTITKSKPPSSGLFTAATTLSEGTVIPAGEALTETVTFAPTAAVASMDGWDITADDGSGPQTVSLTGTGAGAPVTASFSVVSGGDDGDVMANDMGGGGLYPPLSSPVVSASWSLFGVRRAGPLFGGFEVRTGLLRFRTSLPAGASVTSAVLRLFVVRRSSVDGRRLVAEWLPSAVWPLGASDFSLSPSSSASVGVPLAGLVVGAVNDLPLQNLGAIAAAGDTSLRLHVDGGAPTGENEAFFAAFEDGTAPAPQLLITYTLPEVPVAPASTSLPLVAGTAAVGQSLLAAPGSWSGTTPMTFDYRWQRCGSSGCVDVGSSSSSYLVVQADVGATLRVSVRASNVAGAATAVSEPTAAVPGTVTASFSVVSGGDDGDVMANDMGGGGLYPPLSSPVVSASWSLFGVRRAGPLFGGFEVRTGLLRFRTSLPAGASVTSAVLRLFVVRRSSVDGRRLVAEWLPSAVWPLGASDFSLSPSSSASVGVPLAGLVVGAVNDLPLQNLGAIAAAGDTSLRLHVDGGAPTGENEAFFAAFEDGTAPAPQLLVTYTLP